jgi:multimeric flavodoxin WrbA
MGAPSWQFKKFADASSKPWFTQQWKDKLAAGFTNSATMNGDKLSTLHYFFTLSQQHSMYWVGTGLMPSNAKAATRNDVNYVGSFSGLMTVTPSDASADEMVAGDIATAQAFGKRIAEATAKFSR